MNLIKLKKAYIICLVLTGILTASCSADFSKQQISENVKVVKLSEGNYGVDLANTKIGKKDGAKFSVNLHLADNTFKIKSANGSPAKVIGDIQSYEVNLCTNPTQPDATKIITSPTLFVNRSGAGPHIFTFFNLASSSGQNYYATVKAYDQPNLTGNLLIHPDNKGTPYVDIPGNNIAVSTNFVTIDNSLILTFNDAPNNKLDITANLEDSVPPIIDSTVRPNSGYFGNFSLPDLRVDQGTGGTTQTQPSISINKNGNGLAVWRDTRASSIGVYARFFSDYMPDGNDFNIANVANPIANGANIFNPTVFIADTATSPNSNNGNGFVLWEEAVPDPVAYVNHIYIQPIKNCVVNLTKTQVDTGLTGKDQHLPKISLGGSGSGVKGLIVWYGSSSAGNNDIYARAISNSSGTDWVNGGTLGVNPVIINSNQTATGQINPAISRFSPTSNGASVTWQDDRNGNNDIYMNRLLYSGGGATATVVSQIPSDSLVSEDIGNFDQSMPAIAVDDNGDGLITWQDNRSGQYDIYARKIHSYGVLATEHEFIVSNSAGNKKNPKIVLDINSGVTTGTGVITWEDAGTSRTPTVSTSDIYGVSIRGYDVIGKEFKIDNDTTQTQNNISMTTNDSGKGFVAWQDNRNAGSTNIYGKRIVNFFAQ